MDHTGTAKTVVLLRANELGPGHVPISGTPRQPTTPNPPHFRPKALESEVVANNPVLAVVASQLLDEFLVLLLDRKMQIDSTPFRQRCKRTLESTFRRLSFDHPSVLLRFAPVMGKPQEVECRWFGWFPILSFGVVRLGRLKPHQSRLLRVDRQSVLAHPLG